MIVHGVLSLDVGGLERIVVSLAKYVVARGEAVTVVCVERPGALAPELESIGVKVVSLNKPPGRYASYIVTAEKVLRELQPRVLHTHQIGAAWYLAPAAKRLSVRVVHTEHGNPFARATSWLETMNLRHLMHRTAKSIDAFAAVSPEIAKTITRFRTVPAAKVTVVPNGIAIVEPTRSRDKIETSLSIPQGMFIIGSVSRLNEVKRQDILLRAVAKVTNAWVILVGDGPERDSLERLAEELGIRSRVIFAGYQPQPADFLAAMDVFALTSRSEGFPVSLLEAWAARVPVIVSATGGLRSIVRDGETGWLVPVGDVDAFAAAFEKVRSNRNQSRELAAAGHRELLEHYTLDRMTERYESLYR
jgi:glycosyltransferase involved in cell wall biosynthesis